MQKNSASKGAIHMKFVAIAAIAIIAVAAIAVWQLGLLGPSNNGNPVTLPPMNVTVVGFTGNQRVLNSSDIAKLNAYSSYGGTKNSVGVIGSYGNYTGIPVKTLLNLVGDIASGQTLVVTANDGYAQSFTYQQVNGQGYKTFNAITGSQVNATQPVNLVLAYYVNGTGLSSGSGPLRLTILGTEGLLTESRLWTKQVSRLEIITNWSLLINSTNTVSMSRNDYTTEMNANLLSYTDSKNSTWDGVALWRIVSYSIDKGSIDNESLASGYVIKVIGSDGYSVLLNDTRVSQNNNIIVAGKVNGTIPSLPYWPLTLQGSSLSKKETIKGIAQIQIIPLPHIKLTLTASNGTSVVLYSQNIAVLTSITDDGGYKNKAGVISGVGNYTGIQMLTLLNKIGGIGSAQNVTVKAGDGYSVTYTYQQIVGQNMNTYNQTTGVAQTPIEPLAMILAYRFNNADLSSSQGPLRLGFVGSEGLLTDSSKWTSNVVTIQIVS
jgi:hypothetical protein